VTSSDPLLSLLAERADRSFRVTTPAQVLESRKAIIGPRSDLLDVDARTARELLRAGQKPSARQLAALEQVIRLQRPSALCRRDSVTPLPEGGNWLAEQWSVFQPVLQRLQGSVARIERIDDPQPQTGTGRTSLGTGFLVAADVLMTAAHVVDLLSFSTGVLERGQAAAEFQGYFGASGSELRQIVEVIAIDSVHDLALLRIDPIATHDDSRPVLNPISVASKAGQAICVVGYPLQDPRNPPSFVSIIFENRFGVKRAALGEITSCDDIRFSHDCSTLGGNSGSPVVDLVTGQVCGVHVSGQAMSRNDAVCGKIAQRFIDRTLGRSAGDNRNGRQDQIEPASVKEPTEQSAAPEKSSHGPHDSSKTQPVIFTGPSIPRRSLRMKPPNTKDFGLFYQQLLQADSEICNEIAATRSEMATTESAGGSENEFQLETIVLTKGRPVLDIKAGAAVVEFSEVESEIWRKRLTDANSVILPNIPAVGRIELLNHPRGTQWIGTGWLIRDNVVVTNRHVASEFGEANGGTFVFRPGFDGTPMGAQIDFIEEFGSTGSFEFPLFKIMHIEPGGGPDLAFLRIEPVNGQTLPKPVTLSSSAVQNGEQVAVIGYPARDPFFPNPEVMDQIFNKRYDKKRLAPGLVIGRNADRIFHDCSTLGGNSGGEVISLKTGHAVALHFAGTLFARNHAVPIDVVASRLDDVLRGRRASSVQVSSTAQREVMNLQSSTSDASGSRFVEATIPIRVRVEIGDIVSSTPAVTTAPPATAPIQQPKPPVAAVVVPDDDLIATVEAKPEDYRDRRGYDPNFLGDGFEVPLPKLNENIDDILRFKFDGTEQHVLHYQHFSVVMSSSRRMCRFSACNIDGKQSKKKKRTGWQFDPRIPKEAQIMKECYGNEPKFSRGHMTRREDPVWGSDTTATLGNSDSMHVTNAVPQMQPFNAGIWLGLEDYALDNAREDDMRICVFTGPFLARNDPFRYHVKIPVTFWKVIAFIHDETGELCATGYTMSQKSFLKEEEFVFSQHENHQRPISEIERRAGISFGGLADLDPLRDATESTPTMLTSLSQVRFTE